MTDLNSRLTPFEKVFDQVKSLLLDVGTKQPLYRLRKKLESGVKTN